MNPYDMHPPTIENNGLLYGQIYPYYYSSTGAFGVSAQHLLPPPIHFRPSIAAPFYVHHGASSTSYSYGTQSSNSLLSNAVTERFHQQTTDPYAPNTNSVFDIRYYDLVHGKGTKTESLEVFLQYTQINMQQRKYSSIRTAVRHTLGYWLQEYPFARMYHRTGIANRNTYVYKETNSEKFIHAISRTICHAASRIALKLKLSQTTMSVKDSDKLVQNIQDEACTVFEHDESANFSCSFDDDDDTGVLCDRSTDSCNDSTSVERAPQRFDESVSAKDDLKSTSSAHEQTIDKFWDDVIALFRLECNNRTFPKLGHDFEELAPDIQDAWKRVMDAQSPLMETLFDLVNRNRYEGADATRMRRKQTQIQDTLNANDGSKHFLATILSEFQHLLRLDSTDDEAIKLFCTRFATNVLKHDHFHDSFRKIMMCYYKDERISTVARQSMDVKGNNKKAHEALRIAVQAARQKQQSQQNKKRKSLIRKLSTNPILAKRARLCQQINMENYLSQNSHMAEPIPIPIPHKLPPKKFLPIVPELDDVIYGNGLEHVFQPTPIETVISESNKDRSNDRNKPMVANFVYRNKKRGGKCEVENTEQFYRNIMAQLKTDERDLLRQKVKDAIQSERKKGNTQLTVSQKQQCAEQVAASERKRLDTHIRMLNGEEKEIDLSIFDSTSVPLPKKKVREKYFKQFYSLRFLMQCLKDCDNKISPARNGWGAYCGRRLDGSSNKFQLMCSCIWSRGTSDKKLFDVIMILRRLGLFTEQFLGNPNNIRWIQALLNFAGYNWWSDGAVHVVAGTIRILRDYMGCVPGTNSRDILELLTFHGVGRKVFFLILHDVLGDRRSGIVSDVHVAKGAVALGWVKETDVEKPDQIAKELEEWLDPIYFFDVNLTLAGLRQLWYEDDLQIRCRNRQTIQTFAARLQITSLVQKVIEA